MLTTLLRDYYRLIDLLQTILHVAKFSVNAGLAGGGWRVAGGGWPGGWPGGWRVAWRVAGGG